MVLGATYTFRFDTQDLLKVIPSQSSVQAGLAGDSNFGAAAAFPDAKGVTVTFVYSGRGSTVAGAAGEMQSVLNDNRNFVSGSLVFVSAQVGAAGPRENSGDGPGVTGIAIFAVIGILALAFLLHEVNN